jgi:hypothetical protein
MLLLLERDAHGRRLRTLLRRFRDQEQRLAGELQRLQGAADRLERAASPLMLEGQGMPRELLAECSALQREWEERANDLVDVRTAIAGAGEELALHEMQRSRASGRLRHHSA